MQFIIILLIALRIGFATEELSVVEGSVVTLEVRVLSGTLTTNATILFSTQDSTALRKLYDCSYMYLIIANTGQYSW